MIRIRAREKSLEMIPTEARDVTLIGVDNPVKALDGIEAVIASRVGAAQSFLLHQFIIGARDIFLGIKESDKTDGVIGDEIANFNLTGESKDRVWLIAQRNEAYITTLIERVFTARGAKITREKYKEREIIRSSEERRGAAVIVGDFLALGKRERLRQLIDSYQAGLALITLRNLSPRTKSSGREWSISFQLGEGERPDAGHDRALDGEGSSAGEFGRGGQAAVRDERDLDQ